MRVWLVVFLRVLPPLLFILWFYIRLQPSNDAAFIGFVIFVAFYYPQLHNAIDLVRTRQRFGKYIGDDV